MARIAFTEENKRTSSYTKLPKLSLEKGEVARIALYEDPIVAYVHNLQKPKLENGKPLKKINDRGQEVYEYTFVSNPLSKGDLSILEDKGIDPKNCLLSRAHKENPEQIPAPRRKLAMNVLRYGTDEKGSKLSSPPSIENLIWSFTDRVFSDIIDAFSEYIDAEGPEAIKTHDIILRCKNKQFQQYDISVSPKSFIHSNKAVAELAKAVIKDNRYDEDGLRQACGREKETRWIEADIADVLAAWKEVSASEGRAPLDLVESSNTVDDSLSALLEDDDVTTDTPEKNEEEIDFSSLVSDDSDDSEDEDGDISSFADLLADD